MKHYRLLDLFCGAGGCSEGYRRAGFIVHGIDNKRQPRYPYTFTRADALEYLEANGHLYDVIHASPPCQTHTNLKHLHKHSAKYTEKHQDMVDETRRLLLELGKPYVVENVIGAPLYNPVVLCGSMFGLKVYRHRLFESNVLLMQPQHIAHNDKTPGAGRGISPKGFVSVTGTGGQMRGADYGGIRFSDYAKNAMDIHWMSRAELSQSIPPTYTEYIGRQLIRYLENREAVSYG